MARNGSDGGLPAIRRVLAQYRSTDGQVSEAEITEAWTEYEALRGVARAIAASADVHACNDCGLPTSYAIGSYWLAPDDLWVTVVGDDTMVLCPGCFHDRASERGVAVSWRATAAALPGAEAPS